MATGNPLSMQVLEALARGDRLGAIKLMRENPKEAAEIVSKKLGWSPEAVLRAHKISGPLLPFDGRMSVEALAVMQDTLLEYGLIKKKLPLEAHYMREFTPVKM